MGEFVWQDFVMMMGSIGFIASLLPSVFSKDKPQILTSISTAIILISFTICYLSMGLYLSSILTVFTAILWIILARQKYKIGRQEK